MSRHESGIFDEAKQEPNVVVQIDADLREDQADDLSLAHSSTCYSKLRNVSSLVSHAGFYFLLAALALANDKDSEQYVYAGVSVFLSLYTLMCSMVRQDEVEENQAHVQEWFDKLQGIHDDIESKTLIAHSERAIPKAQALVAEANLANTLVQSFKCRYRAAVVVNLIASVGLVAGSAATGDKTFFSVAKYSTLGAFWLLHCLGKSQFKKALALSEHAVKKISELTHHIKNGDVSLLMFQDEQLLQEQKKRKGLDSWARDLEKSVKRASLEGDTLRGEIDGLKRLVFLNDKRIKYYEDRSATLLKRLTAEVKENPDISAAELVSLVQEQLEAVSPVVSGVTLFSGASRDSQLRITEMPGHEALDGGIKPSRERASTAGELVSVSAS